MGKYMFIIFSIFCYLISGCIVNRQINTYEDYLNWKFSSELRQGFPLRVELIINRGVDINRVVMNGKTINPLIYSIQQQNTAVARLLIDKGADVNISDQRRNTPLVWAIIMKDFELVEILLEKGVDVKVISRDKNTVLDYAAQNNAPYHIFEKLLNRDAPISKNTLEYAINKKCRYNVIKLLLINSMENDIHVKIDGFLKSVILNDFQKIREEMARKENLSAQLRKDVLYYCVSLGYIEQLELFFKQDYVNLFNEYELTLAQVAAEYGQLNILKKLVNYGINIEEVNISETSLLLSIRNNNRDMVEYLLSTGVKDLNIRNNYDRLMYNNDILLYACRYSDIEMVQLLRKYNIEFKNKENGVIPFAILDNENNIEIINYLSSFGFDKNKYDGSFGSLLISATRSNVDINIFKWILNNTNIIETRNPVLSLITYGENEKLEYLLNSGWEIGNEILFEAIWKANFPAVKIIVEHGVDITKKTADGGSALYHAAKMGYENIVLYLLSIGADINEQTKDGDTALTIACKNYQLEVVDILLKHNADKERRNNENKNAIEITNVLGYVLIENILKQEIQ